MYTIRNASKFIKYRSGDKIKESLTGKIYVISFLTVGSKGFTIHTTGGDTFKSGLVEHTGLKDPMARAAQQVPTINHKWS